MSSAINPGLSVRTGGFVWFNETTGGRSKGYVLYDTGTAVPPATFSKANGFGEVVAVCQAAPIEIGNRVWDDVDGDGIQDPGEAALDGVVVELLAPGGAVLGTATTANGGNYYFSSSAGTTTGNAVYNIAGLTPLTSGYVLRIATGQAALGGRLVTRANSDGSANGDSRDSDGVIVGASAQIPVSTGAAGANDHTFDFGFTRVVVPTLSLGNFVWTDTNNDGVVSAGETGIDGVTVRLLNATGTVVLATQTTAGGGFYLFTGLTPGDYVVEAVTPVGYTSSSGGGTEPASDPDNDVNNDDNGTTTGAVVRSLPVTLTPGGEPVNDGDANPDSNLSVDFGFVPGGGGGGGGVEIGGADICLQQTLPGSVRAGDQLALTYTTVNRGPNSATDVMIEGVIPQFTTLVSATPTSGGVCTVTGGMLDCRWPGLTPMGPAGDRTVRVVLQVNAGVPAGSTIWAWFMAASATVDPYPACNMVDGYVFVVDSATPAVDLAITGTARVGAQTGAAVAGLVGESVAVRFAVTNAGASPARGTYALLLDDANGLIVRGAVASQGAVGVANATAGTWDTGAIAPGATATLDLTVAAANGAAVRLQAVRVTGAPADPNAVNDSADVTIDGIGPGGGRSVAVGNVDGVAGGEIIAAGGRGDSPQVFVFSGAGVAARPFYAFDRAFLGGVRLASCDVNGDGIDELIAAQGPGGGRVRVLALTGGAVTDLVSFDAYETGFTGGVNVACGDLDGDGRAEVVVGPDSGRAPDVKVFSISGASAVVTTQFQAYEPAFTGGVRVSAARFTGSGLVGAFNVATMPGPGRATELRLWQVIGASAARTAAVALFGTTGGAQVLLGDVNGDAGLDLLVMPDGGAPVLVQAYSLTTGALVLSAPTGTGGYTGLNAAIGRLAGGPGVPELVVGSGPGMAPTVSSFVITPGGAVSQRLGFTALEQP